MTPPIIQALLCEGSSPSLLLYIKKDFMHRIRKSNSTRSMYWKVTVLCSALFTPVQFLTTKPIWGNSVCLLATTSRSLNKALPWCTNSEHHLLASCWERGGFSPICSPSFPSLSCVTHLVTLLFKRGTLNNTFQHRIVVTSAWETRTLSLPPFVSHHRCFIIWIEKEDWNSLCTNSSANACAKCLSLFS